MAVPAGFSGKSTAQRAWTKQVLLANAGLDLAKFRNFTLAPPKPGASAIGVLFGSLDPI